MLCVAQPLSFAVTKSAITFSFYATIQVRAVADIVWRRINVYVFSFCTNWWSVAVVNIPCLVYPFLYADCRYGGGLSVYLNMQRR